jgi:hypothetical protein
MTPESLLIPFRTSSPSLPRLPQGYAIVSVPDLNSADLNYLLGACGELPRTATIWQRVLERSAWHLGVHNANGQWVGFIRATTDQALNANLWDLLTDPAETLRQLAAAAGKPLPVAILPLGPLTVATVRENASPK